MEQINENFKTTLLHSKFHRRLHSHINSMFEHFYVFTCETCEERRRTRFKYPEPEHERSRYVWTYIDRHTHTQNNNPSVFCCLFFTVIIVACNFFFFSVFLRCSRRFEYSLRRNICDNNPMFDIELECFCCFADRHIFICHNISNVSVFGSFSSLFLFN